MYLGGEEIPSHQYSVTQYERDLRQGNAPGKEGHARECWTPIFCRLDGRLIVEVDMTSHGVQGIPGVFFKYVSLSLLLDSGVWLTSIDQLRNITDEGHPYRDQTVFRAFPDIVSFLVHI